MKRNEFIKGIAVGGSFLLTAPVIFNSCSKEDTEPEPGSPNNGGSEVVVDLSDAKYSVLGSDGGYVYVGNIIVIRISSGSYIALSKICTHQQCTVTYNNSTGQLPCPCHGSVYDANGNVLNGPAVNPLTKYSVILSNNKLTIK
jgi:cytochrome b6-f complex iron-sulfur subunit